MERTATMGCSASISRDSKLMAYNGFPKQNGHSNSYDSTQAPSSTPEPEEMRENDLKKRVSDVHLYERIQADLHRANEFAKGSIQLDSNEELFLPQQKSHVPRGPVAIQTIAPSDSQTDFFQMLDRKISEGPDYASDQSQT